MPTNHDGFFNISANASGFALSDAWVSNGGRYIYLEFSKDGVPSCTIGITGSTCDITEPIWTTNLTTLGFSASSDFLADIVHISHEYRTSPTDDTVVIVKLRSPRIISRSETVQLLNVIGNIASNGKEFVSYNSGSLTIRNYSNVNASAGISYALRQGSSPYIKQTDPLLDSDKEFHISSAALVDGSINGSGITINTTRGGVTEISSDDDFNSNDSFRFDSNWIGRLQGFSGTGTKFTWLCAVKIPENGAFYFSKVLETSENQQEYDNIGRPDIPFPGGPAAIFSLGSGSSSVTYTITDYWSIDEASESHIFTWETPTVNIQTGNFADRTYTFAVTSDGDKVTVYQGAGNVMRKANHDVVEPTLSGDEYFAFRSLGQVKLAEFIQINDDIGELKAQEYLAQMDEKYNTKANEYYVDFTAGVDTNAGTIAAPLETISSALSKCLGGWGDQILIKNGGAITNAESISLRITGDSFSPLGYSPDYPFVLGTYDSRASGRPTLDFDYDEDRYILSTSRNENCAIYGLHLKSAERDPDDALFIGQETLKLETNGFGLQSFSTFVTQSNPSSFQVIDCEIENTLRHAISIENTSSAMMLGSKYSAVRRNTIHDSFNGNYMSQNQNHETGISDYGIAGVYTENLTGIHIEENVFFRVGWSPYLEIDAGITNFSGEFSTNGNSILSSQLGTYATSYSAWTGASGGSHDLQRVHITEIGGTAANEFVFVSSGIFYTGSGITYGLPVKDFTGIIANGDDVKFSILDPYPKCSGNADIVIGSSMRGPVSISDCIFVDSSGFNIISSHSFYEYECVSSDSMFSVYASSDYSKIDSNWFGGSTGTDIIRKSPTNLFVGTCEIKDHSAKRLNLIQTTENKGSVNLEISHNIFSGITSSEFLGYGDFENKIVSSAILFSENMDFQQRITIEKNTFHSIPGSIIANHTDEIFNTNIDIIINRNILDQEFDYPIDWMYSFTNPVSDVTSPAFFVIDFGGNGNKNIYGRQNTSTAPTDRDFAAGINFFGFIDLSFPSWLGLLPTENGDWKDISYTDTSVSLATYNGSILSGATSAVQFALDAIVAHDDGWDTTYGASSALSHIRLGWTPTNLDQANYGNDYVGAVEFDFTPPAVTFIPAFAQDTTEIGFGKGQ